MILDDLSRTQIEHLIDEYIRSERDREILKRRLLDGVIYDDLAFEFNLSERHIKRIVYAGKEKLIKHI